MLPSLEILSNSANMAAQFSPASSRSQHSAFRSMPAVALRRKKRDSNTFVGKGAGMPSYEPYISRLCFRSSAKAIRQKLSKTQMGHDVPKGNRSPECFGRTWLQGSRSHRCRENTVTTGIRPAKQSTPGLLRRHTLESVVSRAPELLQEHVTGAKKAGLYCWNAQIQGMSRLPLSELLEVSKNQDLPVFCG